MIEYKEDFHFSNDIGEFTVRVHTEEHPSDYGNGTLLVFEIESDYPVEKRRQFDVRYSDLGMADITRQLLKENFGVDF